MISVQALLNIAVATASLPNTGVPLPFISYGGSSLVLMMACIGLLLNISRYPDGPDAEATATSRPHEDDWNRRWEREPRHLCIPARQDRVTPLRVPGRPAAWTASPSARAVGATRASGECTLAFRPE